jgi:Domain of unknown function (DUF6378)
MAEPRVCIYCGCHYFEPDGTCTDCHKDQSSNTTNLQTTLNERGKRYGDFSLHAKITQDLKLLMQQTPRWNALNCSQREALEMIAHKIGRILNGDPNYADSWVDIAGYAQLVADRLQEKQK